MSRVTRPPKEVVRDVIEAKVLEPAPWGGRLRQMPVSVMAYFMSKPSAPPHCPTKARSGRAPYDLPQDGSKTAPSAPKMPLRLSKSVQDGSVSLQELSKSSPGEGFEARSRLQELSRGAFQASNCCPATSSL